MIYVQNNGLEFRVLKIFYSNSLPVKLLMVSKNKDFLSKECYACQITKQKKLYECQKRDKLFI